MQEYDELLQDRIMELLSAAGSDKRSLLEKLKQFGITKMGHRQKVAAVLQSLADEGEAVRNGLPADIHESTALPASGSSACGSADFWATISDQSEESVSAGSLAPQMYVSGVQDDKINSDTYREDQPLLQKLLPSTARNPRLQASEPEQAVAQLAPVQPVLASGGPDTKEQPISLEKRTSTYPGADAAYPNSTAQEEQLEALRERGGGSRIRMQGQCSVHMSKASLPVGQPCFCAH
jgi:hypothetical protein